MSNQKAHLDNWSVIGTFADEFKAPEQNKMFLIGTVKGHPRLKDGKVVRTSTVKLISYKNKVAVTNNTEYTLGEPDPDFVKFLVAGGWKIEDYEFGAIDLYV